MIIIWPLNLTYQFMKNLQVQKIRIKLTNFIINKVNRKIQKPYPINNNHKNAILALQQLSRPITRLLHHQRNRARQLKNRRKKRVVRRRRSHPTIPKMRKRSVHLLSKADPNRLR